MFKHVIESKSAGKIQEVVKLEFCIKIVNSYWVFDMKKSVQT